MKKLITLIMVVVMLATMSFATLAAAPSTLTDALTGVGIVPADGVVNQNVPADIQVDVGQTGTFIDGPVSKTISGSNILADYKATLYMTNVRNLYQTFITGAELVIADNPALVTRLNNSMVTGQFVVKITYPESLVIPASITEGTGCSGFSTAVLNAFTETVPRTVTAGASGTKVLTITLDVIPVSKSVMSTDLAAYLPDLALTFTGIGLGLGEHKVVGTITGYTDIKDADNLLYKVEYTGKQGTDAGITGTEISETVILSQQGGINAGPGSSAGKKEDITVTIDLPGIKDVDDIVIPGSEKNPSIDIDDIIEDLNLERDGFVFEGFYDDQYYTNKLSGEVKITENTTIHGRWINVTVPEIFDADNHIQYIHGYPDETVRPESNVSREEIATMFYRLLKEEVREKLTTDANSFSDVESDRWSNNAVSTMANGGYIKGYADGTFRPEAYITRAELATIAFRFLDAAVTGEMNFNDIGGHWAEENIKSIANNAWIMGYRDGSFKPDEYITRAEAITIINRIVVRYVNEHGLIGDEKQWIDNPADAWYYYAVVEATHEHDHERAEDKYNELWNKSDSGMLVD